MTKIPWTEVTWNPVIGCTKIAPGCKNCYAEKMAKRLYCMGMASPWKNPEYMKFEDGWKNGHIELCEHRLNQPLHWRKPRKIFVCSMSDLFHEKVPFGFIEKVMGVIEQCPQHDFQILTKRPERMLDYFNGLGKRFELSCCQNLWLGTSISIQADADKNIPILLQIPAAVRFISLEPMLPGRIDLREWIADCGCVKCQKHYFTDLDELLLPENDNAKCPECGGEIVSFSGYTNAHEMLHQVIIGCESGPRARLCSIDGIRDVVKQCRAAGVPVFVKQVPINGKCNKNPEEWPEDLRVQEYPK